jgi:hypothetical protein
VLIVYNVTACELLLAVGVVDVRWSGRVMRLGNVRNIQKILYLKNFKLMEYSGYQGIKKLAGSIYNCTAKDVDVTTSSRRTSTVVNGTLLEQ